LNKTVPILITLDIHSYSRTEKDLPSWFERTLEVLDELSIKASFLFPAVFAEQFTRHVRMIKDKGHEIGCHGLTHELNEQYHRMPFKRQKAILYEAKSRIEQITGEEVLSFRSPVYGINGDTVRALEECGFRVDSSVNPQRLGLFSSDVTNTGWLYAPRRPYHPSFENPFVRGSSAIWEISQSAFIFPFMSNTGMAFGGAFMRYFYKMLYLESLLTKNYIVYMFHPEDVYPDRARLKYTFKWRHLLPARSLGFEVRKILFSNKCPKTISRQNVNLLRSMKKTHLAAFVTYKEALRALEG